MKKTKGMKGGRKPIKPKTLAQLKKQLDKVFSEYVRKTDAQRCYTCGKTRVTLQCGHFISRSYLATRWDLDNCKNQCIGCNIFGNGKPLDFEEHLIRDIGKKKVEQLKARRHKILKLTSQWYMEQIEFYKDTQREGRGL